MPKLLWVRTPWRLAGLLQQLCHVITGKRSEPIHPGSGPIHVLNACAISLLLSLSETGKKRGRSNILPLGNTPKLSLRTHSHIINLGKQGVRAVQDGFQS